MLPDRHEESPPQGELMLSSVTEFAADIAPNAWRRLLTYLVDGLRASRSEPTPLDAKPFTSKGIVETLIRSGRR